MNKEKIMVLALTVVSMIVVIILIFPNWFALNTTFIFAQIVSLRGLLSIVLLVVGGGLVATGLLWSVSFRSMLIWVGIIFLMGFLVNTSIIVQRGVTPTPAITASEENETITILAWNIQNSQVPAEEISNLILDTKPTFVSLPEAKISLGERVVELLESQGFYMEMFPAQGGNKDYTLVLVNKEYAEYEMSEQIGRTGLATVIVEPVNKTENKPVFMGVHTMSPSAFNRMRYWRDDIDWIEEQCGNYSNAILAGDFNQTVDHWHGRLLDCIDLGTETKQAALGTWPTKLPQFLGAQIDHILSTNTAIKIVDFKVLDTSSDSDHRPVLGKIIVPANLS